MPRNSGSLSHYLRDLCQIGPDVCRQYSSQYQDTRLILRMMDAPNWPEDSSDYKEFGSCLGAFWDCFDDLEFRAAGDDRIFFDLIDAYEAEHIRQEGLSAQRAEHDKELERRKLKPGLRIKVFDRDNYRCRRCGNSPTEGSKLVADHVHPVALGGKTELQNLQTLCAICNSGKGMLLLKPAPNTCHI